MRENTSWESLLDRESSKTADGALAPPPITYFTGPTAEKVHGGPVVVTTDTPGENYQHLGNGPSDATDPKTGHPDVMYGVQFDTGERYEVSDLDVAILQDLGYHTKVPAPEMVPKDDRISQIIHSLVSTLPGTDAILPVANAVGNTSPTHTGGNVFPRPRGCQCDQRGFAVARRRFLRRHRKCSRQRDPGGCRRGRRGFADAHHRQDLSDIAGAVASATSQIVTAAEVNHAQPNLISTPLVSCQNGGSFWDQAADAIHHATAALAGPVDVSPEPMVTEQHQTNDVHTISLWNVFTGVNDHLTDGHAALALGQAEHMLSQFEAPTLHLADVLWHH